MKASVRCFSLPALVFLIIFAPTEGASGAWPDDSETSVAICMAEGTQEHPRIVTDGASGAIIVWQDVSASSPDIYAQRVDARGEIRWTKDGVPVCLEKDTQWQPNLVYDEAGGAIIAWWDKRSGEWDIYAQRINSGGEVMWQAGGIPICAASGEQQELNMIADGSGGAIIVWHDYRSAEQAPDVYAQRINAEGRILWKRDGVIASTEQGYQNYPILTSDGAGGAIIAWHDWQSGSNDIYAQHLDAGGKILWQESGVLVCKMPENQWYAEICSDGKGGAIIVWMDFRSKFSWDIYAQRLDAQGKPHWQENGIPVCTAQGDQYDYSIMADGSGGAFITWYDHRGEDWDIYAQHLDASGESKWPPDGLPVCTAANDQFNPSIVSDGVDGVVITWWDKRDIYADIYAQRIGPDGKFNWVEGGAAICTAEGTQQDPNPVNSGVGSVIVTWWDQRRLDADIYAQRIFSE